jgi:hypothetical protein
MSATAQIVHFPHPGREPSLPRFLHEPCWQYPDFSGFRQNTDPWVFGDAFLYSNCKQPSQRGLQHLAPRSMIVFGSTQGVGSTEGERFVLDTVFVVGEVLGSYSPIDADLPVPEAFRVCTIDALASGKVEDATASFTLYRGATPADGLGTFSFVPCLRATADSPAFPRPPVELPDVINPRSWRSPSGAAKDRPIEEVTAAWSEVVSQVEEAGLALGCALELPRHCG